MMGVCARSRDLVVTPQIGQGIGIEAHYKNIEVGIGLIIRNEQYLIPAMPHRIHLNILSIHEKN